MKEPKFDVCILKLGAQREITNIFGTTIPKLYPICRNIDKTHHHGRHCTQILREMEPGEQRTFETPLRKYTFKKSKTL